MYNELTNMTTNRKSGSTENITKICSYEEPHRTFKCNNKLDPYNQKHLQPL